MLYVAEDREQKSLHGFWSTITAERRTSIQAVTMDMWDAYISSVQNFINAIYFHCGALELGTFTTKKPEAPKIIRRMMPMECTWAALREWWFPEKFGSRLFLRTFS